MSLIKRKPEFFDTDLLDFPTRFFDNTFFRDREFPMVNIRNLENEFKVELAVPGYKKEDLHVEVAEGVLTVSSEQKEEKESAQDGWKRREFRYNSFSRSFQLPENADADKVNADFKDGVLNLSIPKKAEAKPARTKAVEIK
jgi:HSP20 family protein